VCTAAASKRRGRGAGERGARLGVVDHGIVIVLVQDLEAEHVRSVAADIQGGHHAAVVAGPVDGARALVLRLAGGDHQPVVAGALERQVGGWDLPLRVAGRHGVPSVLAGVEAEVGLASERRVGGVATSRDA
jgi:hypothetical protein